MINLCRIWQLIGEYLIPAMTLEEVRPSSQEKNSTLSQFFVNYFKLSHDIY